MKIISKVVVMISVILPVLCFAEDHTTYVQSSSEARIYFENNNEIGGYIGANYCGFSGKFVQRNNQLDIKSSFEGFCDYSKKLKINILKRDPSNHKILKFKLTGQKDFNGIYTVATD